MAVVFELKNSDGDFVFKRGGTLSSALKYTPDLETVIGLCRLCNSKDGSSVFPDGRAVVEVIRNGGPEPLRTVEHLLRHNGGRKLVGDELVQLVAEKVPAELAEHYLTLGSRPADIAINYSLGSLESLERGDFLHDGRPKALLFFAQATYAFHAFADPIKHRRDFLRPFLDGHDIQIRVIGSCSAGAEAIRAVRTGSVGTIFLWAHTSPGQVWLGIGENERLGEANHGYLNAGTLRDFGRELDRVLACDGEGLLFGCKGGVPGEAGQSASGLLASATPGRPWHGANADISFSMFEVRNCAPLEIAPSARNLGSGASFSKTIFRRSGA
jgi:hypothetical protein